MVKKSTKGLKWLGKEWKIWEVGALFGVIYGALVGVVILNWCLCTGFDEFLIPPSHCYKYI